MPAVSSQPDDAPRQATLRTPLGRMTLAVPPRGDLVGDRMCADGVWEPLESRIALALGAGGRVLDGGAHLGYFSALLLRADPDTRVVAVEPAARQRALLRRNTAAAATRVDIVPGALVDTPGDCTLHSGGSNSGDDHLARALGPTGSERVSGVVGDALLDDVPDLIKLDVQGAECAALDGLTATLARGVDRVALLVELWPWGLERFGSSGHELVDLLAAHGRALFELDPAGDRLIAVSAAQLRDKVRRWLTPSSGGFVNVLALPQRRIGRLRQAGIDIVTLAAALDSRD